MTSDGETELDEIKSALRAATPAPDPATRAAHLRLAQENFDALQGSRNAPRPTSATSSLGRWIGVKTMLNNLTTKGGLTVTTALVACGFLFLTPQGKEILRPGHTIVDSDPLLPAKSPVTLPPEAGQGTRLATDDGTAEAGQDQADAPLPKGPDATAQNSVVSADQLSSTLTDGTALPQQMTDTTVPANRAVATQELATTTADASLAERDESGAVTGTIGLGGTAPAAATLDRRQAAPAPAPMDAEAYSSGVAASEAFGSLADDLQAVPEPNTEAFANAADNPLKITQESPVSTFSIDVDTAAYSIVRNSLQSGMMPPANAVRIEEMVNYFPYSYPAPDAGEAPFRPTISMSQTPWNPDTQLVTIGIQGEMPALADRPPLNLVFLIDTSGSMDDPAKLPLLKQSFRLMLDQLRPEDQVAIVEYAGSAGQVLRPTSASQHDRILKAINNLGAGGSTNGQGGLQQAYAVAESMAEDGEVSRIILATDGDFNVGLNDPEALKDYIAGKRETGVYLSVLGFGRGNLDDATMQALAQNGNGTAAYIDTLSEAQKVLVDQLTGALFPIANDVKVQVEFNPAAVAEYRLIGYETRALNREDFNNDAVDAGELGAGHTVTAIYEITPVGSPAQLSDPLRYGAPVAASAPSDEIGFLKLRYKEPGAKTSQLISTPITYGAEAGTDARFAAAVAGFGQLLKGGQFMGEWNYADAIALANANKGEDPFGYRTEAVQLMRLAQSLSGQ
jgi:Ca-activated chloride channel family protein